MIEKDPKSIKDEVLSHFTCQNSGNCCRVDGVVYATQKEISQMAACLDMDVATFMLNYTRRKNGWHVVADRQFRSHCFLNKKNQCAVYKGRPKACRTYPDWPEIWESKDRFLSELILCPGLKAAYDHYRKMDELP